MEEELGTILIDGRIIDLDKMSREELDRLDKELENKEKKIREEIDKLLGVEEDLKNE